jgi:hypothetical protein
MSAGKISRCQRCGKRLKKGGDNYRLECSIVADFDGYIDASLDRSSIVELAEAIVLSGLTEEDLEEQVYFVIKQKLCRDCREEVVAFLKGYNQDE